MRSRRTSPALELSVRGAQAVPRTVAPLLHDLLVWPTLVVALLVNLGLFGFLSIQTSNLLLQFNHVMPLVPLHFDPQGQPDRVEPIGVIFSLPQIGLLVIAGNLLLGILIYRREHLATYFLVGMAALVQLLLWIAAITILRTVA